MRIRQTLQTLALATTALLAVPSLALAQATPPPPVIVTPTEGTFTNDNTPSIAGTANAGNTIVVSFNGTSTVLPLVISDLGTGAWEYTPVTALADGMYAVTATATLLLATSGPSNTRNITIDTVAPAAPVVTTPANGSRSNDATPTYSGTAEPMSTVTIFVDGTAVGTVLVDSSGNWSFTPTTPLADGSHTARTITTDRAGNASPSSATNTFTTDTVAPPAPVVVNPANGSSMSDDTPLYSGTAEPNSTVTVIVDGSSVGTTTADATGNWTFTPTIGLSAGAHMVNSTTTDSAGNVSPTSNTNTFTITAPIVDAGPEASVEAGVEAGIEAGVDDASADVVITDVIDPDAIVTDVVIPDASDPDATPVDVVVADVEITDATITDVIETDTNAEDAAAPDAAAPDAAAPDAAAMEDASISDASGMDATGTDARPDAATSQGSFGGGGTCACAVPGGPMGNNGALALIAAALAATTLATRARRRQ